MQEQRGIWWTTTWTSNFHHAGSAQSQLGTLRDICLPSTCPCALGRATGSLQDPFHGNPLFPPSAGVQDVVGDPLKWRQALLLEDFWFSLLL